MRTTRVNKFLFSQVACRSMKMSDYLNRGIPKRVLRDDGKDYLEDHNLSKRESYYRRQLSRLDELEKIQLGNSIGNGPKKTIAKKPTNSE